MLYILDNTVFPWLSSSFFFFLVSIWSSCQQSHLNYLTSFSLACENSWIHFDSFSVVLFILVFFSLITLHAIIYDVDFLATQFTRHCHMNNVFLDFCTCLLTWLTSNPFPISKKFPSTAILYTLHLIQSFYPVAHFNPYSLPQPLISSLEPWQILLKIWVYYIHWIPLISYSSSIFKELQQAR